jgi:hypothetical protein
VIASIEDQAVIDKILQHLQAKGALSPPIALLPAVFCLVRQGGRLLSLYFLLSIMTATEVLNLALEKESQGVENYFRRTDRC